MVSYKIAISCTKEELKKIHQLSTIERASILFTALPWEYQGPFVPNGFDIGQSYLSSDAAQFIFNERFVRFGITRQTVLYLIRYGELSGRKIGDRWQIEGQEILRLNRERLIHNPVPPDGARQREIHVSCTEAVLKEILARHTPRGRALWLLRKL